MSLLVRYQKNNWNDNDVISNVLLPFPTIHTVSAKSIRTKKI